MDTFELIVVLTVVVVALVWLVERINLPYPLLLLADGLALAAVTSEKLPRSNQNHSLAHQA